MRPVVTVVFKDGLKWAIGYNPPGAGSLTCQLTFWRKCNADLYAATLDAAYRDGADRPTTQGAGDL